MNAITVPKNPPTAMMGIRTSIGSSRRRSFTRSDPLALAVLREQPFGEVHTLGELRHLTRSEERRVGKEVRSWSSRYPSEEKLVNKRVTIIPGESTTGALGTATKHIGA